MTERAWVAHWGRGMLNADARISAFLDTVPTPAGPRIVEVNCINSAGFYGADVERIVLAVERMAPWAAV